MKQDIKEISYNVKKSREEADLIYTIDYLLHNEIEDRFNYTMESNKSVDALYYEVLDDKNGIIDYVIQEVLKDYYYIDDLKINYLIEKEFMKVAYNVKRYYVEASKSKLKQKEAELRFRLKLHFNYCFKTCDETDVKEILRAMSTQTFKDATIKDLKIDLSLDINKNFDKIYQQELSGFKKLHKDEVIESSQDAEQDKVKIGFGWQLYGVVKIIEGLFKL